MENCSQLQEQFRILQDSMIVDRNRAISTEKLLTSKEMEAKKKLEKLSFDLQTMTKNLELAKKREEEACLKFKQYRVNSIDLNKVLGIFHENGHDLFQVCLFHVLSIKQNMLILFRYKGKQ